ncbi:MAG: LysM peptidoglycan-binding domain-containing protein [Desulfovibrionaceae bacterium]|jgi:membrane-bound lytic murein transglycosylase D|nr:LysM peptidoglycan-binding domain-containing protein [Desulfovibrionaceae bacterium]
MKKFAILLAVVWIVCFLASGCAMKGQTGGQAEIQADDAASGIDAAAAEEAALRAEEAAAAQDAAGGDDATQDDAVDTHDLPVADDATPLTPQEQQALDSQTEIHFTLDDQERNEVQLHFKYFTHRNRKTFERWLKRAEPYLPYVKRVLSERGLPEELAYLPFVESGYNARAYSRAGAAGMWQFMPYTGRKYGLQRDWWIDERRDPFKATKAAADYLEELYGMFDDWYLALAAYNAGEGKIKRALDATNCDNFFDLTEKNHTLRRRARLKSETRNYVPKFLAVLKILRNLESLGFEPLDLTREPDLEPVAVKGGTDLLALARATDQDWNIFVEHNRAFRRYVSPPDRESTIYVPAAKVAAVQQFLDKPGATPYAGYRVYKVRSGDSWYRISRNYGVPVSVLKRVNKLSSNLLKPGQQVVVPKSGSAAAVNEPEEQTRRYAAQRGNYIVRRGDTLSEIGKNFGVSVSTLMRANGIRSARSLRVGQKLYIPDQSPTQTALSRKKAEQIKEAVVDSAQRDNYTVRPGDTLYDIGSRFGVSVQDLKKANNIRSARLLRVGQTLAIPGKGNTAPRKTTTAAKPQTYRVRPGDSVWTIAKKFGVAHTDILRWNNLSSRSVIRPGDTLNVSGN